LVGLLLTANHNTFGQSLDKLSDAQLATFLDQLGATPQLSPSAIPKTGNFFSLAHPEWPPLPSNLGDPAWKIAGSSDSYILNDVGIASPASTAPSLTMGAMSMSASTSDDVSLPPGINLGGGTPGNSPQPPPNISNYAKYMAQSFSVVDTNDPSIDTNLFKACASFADTSTSPLLQIVRYRPGCLAIKASHFDYSSDARNFCLVECDTANAPLFKNMDLYQPANNIENGGWLVQGSVPNWQVTDPMFMIVTNISTLYDAFFQAVPYSGPVVTFSGANPYDTVSNLVALQATVTDLSGITNEAWSVNLDGADARYTLGPGNIFTFDSKYNIDGLDNIYLTVGNQARIIDTNNLPDNSQVFFSASGTIPLDFENAQYLAFASDWCPPEAGTNYIYYYLDEAEPFTCTISSPVDGHVVATYSGSTPGAGEVAVPWNMTEVDGLTPYSNDTYVVTFTASDPVTWVSTNSLDKGGNIRVPAGDFLTYEWEDPSTTGGNFLDQHADNAIAGNLLFLYQDIYDQYGLTEYYTWQCGPNRNWAQCQPYNASYKSFSGILAYGATNSAVFSELTMAQAHGSGPTIGGGSYLTNVVWVQDFALKVKNCATPHNWRLRKACIFTCYNADIPLSTAGEYVSWPGACGIRDTGFQQTSLTYKNCGLFFVGGLPQGYINAETSQAMGTADVAELVDQVWVCGEYEYPGACDPTYSFQFAVQATMGVYPDLAKATPALAGFPLCVYDAWQDEALRNLNTTGVKTR
jgi:hypothetical protein